jgi:hypothetical protein
MEFDKRIRNVFVDKEAWPLLQTIPLRISIDEFHAILEKGEKEGILFLALGLEEVSTICNGLKIISRVRLSMDEKATIKGTTITVPTIAIWLEVL